MGKGRGDAGGSEKSTAAEEGEEKSITADSGQQILPMGAWAGDRNGCNRTGPAAAAARRISSGMLRRTGWAKLVGQYLSLRMCFKIQTL